MRSNCRLLWTLYATVVACSGLLLPGQSWAESKEVDLKVSREIIIDGTTRVVLLQVSRITEFTDSADGKAPYAVPSERVLYLMDNLGDKPRDAIQGDAEMFVAGKNESAIRGLPGFHSRSVKSENYTFYLERTEGVDSRLPKVKDVNKAVVIAVTFDHVEVTARKVDLQLRASLHKDEAHRVLFRNVPLE